MNRRKILGLVAGVSGGVVGCLGGGFTSNRSTVSPTASSESTTAIAPGVTPAPSHAATTVPECDQGSPYWVDVSPVDEARSTPLYYAQLPPREQVIVKTAVGSEKWVSCVENEAFFAFRDRVMERRRRIDGETVYLLIQGSPYCLTVWAQDLLISSCPPAD